MRIWFVAAAAALIAGHAQAAILFQETVTASDGFAELDDVAPVAVPSTVWIGVDRGTITSGYWEELGSVTILWWDPYGGGFDSNGDPVPGITGNEYYYLPDCQSTTAAPVCTGSPVRTVLHDNVVQASFVPPPDSNTCTPVFTGNTANCAFYYSFQPPAYDIVVAASDGDVTFTFYDKNPIVPEPATWALMIAGFAATGTALRRVRRARPAAP